MTRNLRKETDTRRRFRKFRNEFCENPTKENEKLYKKQKTNVLSLGGNV